jgi:hypothetical protein
MVVAQAVAQAVAREISSQPPRSDDYKGDLSPVT